MSYYKLGRYGIIQKGKSSNFTQWPLCPVMWH